MSDLSTATVADILAELRHRRDEIDSALNEFGTVADAVEQLVMRAFNISHELLHSERRHTHVTLPRQIAMTLMHENGITWEASARHFNKDHGTAIYAAKMITQREDTDSGFRAEMEHLRTVLSETLKREPSH